MRGLGSAYPIASRAGALGCALQHQREFSLSYVTQRKHIMSQGSYNYTVTKSARHALALKREYTRAFFHGELPLMAERSTHLPRERNLSVVEQLPDFGIWAIAYTADGGLKEMPEYEAYSFIKVPGLFRTVKRVISYKRA